VANVDYTSRERLADSIEKAVRDLIPNPTRAWQTDDFTDTIERSLQDESCRNERTIAYLRLAATAALCVLYLAINGPGQLIRPGLRLAVALVWIAGAIAITIALRRGWYKPWIRRAIPALDATMLVVACTTILPSPVGRPGAAIAEASGLSALLAVTGGLRLTRNSVYYATALAIIAVITVNIEMEFPVETTAIALVPVLVGAALGLAFTRVARRLIATEVGQSAMQGLYAEAKSVATARKDVLEIVAHDLRNPLNTIAMTTQLLTDVPGSEEQQRQRLLVIQRAGERMKRLINDLLSVSIIEAGRLTVDPRPTSVAAIIGDAIEMLRPLAAERAIELEAIASDELPDVQADSARVVQVLSNLVGNAIKFTPKGGRITIGVSAEGSKVRFDISDTGPGIPPEQLSNIFGRFWQAKRADSRGIGLGLSIAKGIVEAHGEQLRVTSTLGVGSTFSFTLPNVDRRSA
jgi:signal transduction histidine kinase